MGVEPADTALGGLRAQAPAGSRTDAASQSHEGIVGAKRHLGGSASHGNAGVAGSASGSGRLEGDGLVQALTGLLDFLDVLVRPCLDDGDGAGRHSSPHQRDTASSAAQEMRNDTIHGPGGIDCRFWSATDDPNAILIFEQWEDGSARPGLAETSYLPLAFCAVASNSVQMSSCRLSFALAFGPIFLVSVFVSSAMRTARARCISRSSSFEIPCQRLGTGFR
jgi:hypothetical protein